ncbi:MAG: DNA polymerase III subunit epsilon [Alphaproteobacteria bacterium]|nr:DNA polymerase III subunit epsilon [Alphaproteobacteria bacterium]
MKKIREIVLDTETTGINPFGKDRLVEIGAIELINGKPSGRIFHRYINPRRRIPKHIRAVHGLDISFLRDFPTFDKIAPQFLEFIGTDSILVAHNADFDINFLNCELKRAGYSTLHNHRVTDTLKLAHQMFPAQRNTLDCLCNRFGIDSSARVFHGALLDAHLLANVYRHLRPHKFDRLIKFFRICKQTLCALFNDKRQIQRIIY